MLPKASFLTDCRAPNAILKLSSGERSCRRAKLLSRLLLCHLSSSQIDVHFSSSLHPVSCATPLHFEAKLTSSPLVNSPNSAGSSIANVTLPREVNTAIPRVHLVVLTALSLVANVPLLGDCLQTTPIPRKRSLAISAVFPCRSVPVALALVRCGRIRAAVATLFPRGRNFGPGGNVDSFSYGWAT